MISELIEAAQYKWVEEINFSSFCRENKKISADYYYYFIYFLSFYVVSFLYRLQEGLSN